MTLSSPTDLAARVEKLLKLCADPGATEAEASNAASRALKSLRESPFTVTVPTGATVQKIPVYAHEQVRAVKVLDSWTFPCSRVKSVKTGRLFVLHGDCWLAIPAGAVKISA